ncbi:hypothetical protein F2Q70_00010163 [Brassica cretica]|uniref:Uncharacterized protein n=1 Tax=Brassica cretica TaxID=69181 RepID=A0A8S9LVR1_BRACR|nr:hypothetical protein F2Q70_00010163 [Brassica cretica]
MTKCRLHARNFMTQEGMTATKKMKRGTTAMPFSVYSLGGSVEDKVEYNVDDNPDLLHKPFIKEVKSLWSRAYNGGTIKGDSQVYTTILETTPCSERGSPFKKPIRHTWTLEDIEVCKEWTKSKQERDKFCFSQDSEKRPYQLNYLQKPPRETLFFPYGGYPKIIFSTVDVKYGGIFGAGA